MPDFKITIPESNALDAINYERDRVIAAGQTDYTTEQAITDAIVTKFAAEREGQLIALAMAKAEQDPDLVAFRAKKEKAQVEALATVQDAVNP